MQQKQLIQSSSVKPPAHRSNTAVCPTCKSPQPGLTVDDGQLYTAERVIIFGYKCGFCGKAVHYGKKSR